MDENRESQELAIPGKIVKSERKGGIAQKVQNILREPATQAITKAPTEQTLPVEQTPGEMSVERAREILKFIVIIPESGLDAHERELNLSTDEQFRRFGGIRYEDIKKAFGVYAVHLLTTHGAKKPHEAYSSRLLKEDFPGPNQYDYEGKPYETYYDLALEILPEFDVKKPRGPKWVKFTLRDGKRHGSFPPARRVQAQIPLVDLEPNRWDEKETGFYDNLSLSRPIGPGGVSGRKIQEADFFALRLYSTPYTPITKDEDIERFHKEYILLHRGMRWTAANLLCWDEKKIVYPDDLDKPPFDKGQAQLTKPKLALPPDKSSGTSGNSGNN